LTVNQEAQLDRAGWGSGEVHLTPGGFLIKILNGVAGIAQE
jgi:hypothetical protein